MKSIIY